MALLDTQTGAIAYLDGLTLKPGMPPAALDARYAGVRDRDVPLPPHPVAGGMLAPVCQFEDGALTAVALYAAEVAGRDVSASDRQRAFLLRRLHLKDPCPDTLGTLRVRCAFGELLLSTDPHTGQAEARIQYALPPHQ